MGVNPRSENDIDEEYLSQLTNAIEMMENKGIYALLDCHQDIFSRYFCGEGIPDWIAEKLGDPMIKTFPFPIARNITRDPDTGYSILDECLKRPFSEYYFTEAGMNGFNML
jgi:endoglycosylceramidase